MVKTLLQPLFLVLVGIFIVPLSVLASVVIYEIDGVSDAYPLLDEVSELRLLGELADQPHMYTFTLTATTTLQVEMRSIYNDSDFLYTGILVKKRPRRGVEEIVRLSAPVDSWEQFRDTVTKTQYLRGPTGTLELIPGTYFFEVSTPINTGKYMVVFGEGALSGGVVSRLQAIRTVQRFHGHSSLRMLLLWQVFLPLVFVCIGVVYVYMRRNRLFKQRPSLTQS